MPLPSRRSFQRLAHHLCDGRRVALADRAPGRQHTGARFATFGLASIDEHLPGGGLVRGALHEVVEARPTAEFAGSAPLFAAGIAARLKGPVLWCLIRRDLVAPGLALANLAPGRVIYAEASRDQDGPRVTVAGLVLVRQKPGSTKGVMFMTIEDDTDVANVIVWPSLYDRQRRLILSSGMMAIRGRYQREGGVTHLIAEHLIDLSDLLRSVGDRDDPFSMRHGRGDEAKIGTHDRLCDESKEIVDAPPAELPEQRIKTPAIWVATRDFR